MINIKDSYQKIIWDISRKCLDIQPWGKTEDTGRGFEVTLVQNGVIVTPTSEVVRMSYRKPDLTEGYIQSTVENGKFYFSGLGSLFTVEGKILAELELQIGTDTVTSIIFVIEVYKSIKSNDLLSSYEFSALQIALADVQEVKAMYSDLSVRLDGALAALSTITSGTPKGVYATYADLQTAKPTGDTGAYLVTADGKWYYWNGNAWTVGGVYQSTGIADFSVLPEKTSFFEYSTNLFNKLKAVSGYYVQYYTGNLISGATWLVSDFTRIKPSTQYTIKSVYHVAFYDENKTFISGINQTSYTNITVTSPANAKYIRFSWNTASGVTVDTQQINEGSTLLAYEQFYERIKLVNLERFPLDQEELRTGLESIIDFGKNMFDKNTITSGRYVNQTNGILDPNVAHNSSDYIRIEPSTAYTLSTIESGRVAFYDSKKIFISGLLLSTNTFTTPVNAKYLRLSTITNVDTIQLEVGTVKTPYEPYQYKFVTDTTDEVILNIPSKMYALVGQELNIYFDNIISGRDTDYTFDVVCGKGQQFQNFWRFIPDVAEIRSLVINAYKGSKLVATKPCNIICKAQTVGSGINKNVIKIGDSTTDNGNGTNKLYENFNADVMDITLLGTRGTAPTKHEGRSGWTATNYTTNDTLLGVSNSFWNPTTSKFDFGYYLTQNSIQVPDYVFINLGINDMFNAADDTAMNSAITNTIGKYDEMIASIKSQGQTKIAIGLTIPPNYSQDAFGKAYSSTQNRARYKRNHDYWVKKLIETYDKREAENIYIVPIHTNLDTRFNMGLEEIQVNARNTMTYSSPVGNGGVHPVVSGYWQIADVEWFFIKSFEV